MLFLCIRIAVDLSFADIGSMRAWIYRLALAALLAPAFLPAFSQTASPSAPAVDPALLAKANAGDPAAQVAAGDACAAGSGPARSNRQLAEDYQQAAAWYRKAADQGDAAGETRLAALYRDGKGVARDMTQAAALYRKAAEQNATAAQGILGVLYSFGQGVPQSYVEAYFWLDLAASAPGPEQSHYAANRQLAGQHVTAEELEAIQDREEKWRAAQPRRTAR